MSITNDHDGPGVVPGRYEVRRYPSITGRHHNRSPISSSGHKLMGWRAGSASPQQIRHAPNARCWCCWVSSMP